MSSQDGTRLRLARLARAYSQQELARLAGVSRQAVAGIEAGRWDPSLRVALALAGALGTAVEDLFGEQAEYPPVVASRLDTGEGGPMGGAGHAGAGSTYARGSADEPPRGGAVTGRVELAQVGATNVALPLAGDSALRAGFVYASGLLATPGTLAESGESAASRGVFRPLDPLSRRLVVAGCDPALALLAEPLSRLRQPVGLSWWPCSSQRALELAGAGLVHAAGVHHSAETNHASAAATWVPTMLGHLGGVGAEVIGFAAWREGLAWRAGEETSLAGHGSPPAAGSLLAMLADGGLRLVNRERGSEARTLLDHRLESEGVPIDKVSGYASAVRAHLLVASAVAAGLGDVGVTIEPAALAYGLGFSSLADERSYLVVPLPVIGTPEVDALLRVLASPVLRAQLCALPGYDPTLCGESVVSLSAGQH